MCKFFDIVILFLVLTYLRYVQTLDLSEIHIPEVERFPRCSEHMMDHGRQCTQATTKKFPNVTSIGDAATDHDQCCAYWYGFWCVERMAEGEKQCAEGKQEIEAGFERLKNSSLTDVCDPSPLNCPKSDGGDIFLGPSVTSWTFALAWSIWFSTVGPYHYFIFK